MPIGHQTALVSSEILTLAAIADVSRNIFDNLEKLHRYNLVADAMLKATIDRIKEYADKETDLSIEGASGIGGG
jgi:transposase